jgi:hypothetical protein
MSRLNRRGLNEEKPEVEITKRIMIIKRKTEDPKNQISLPREDLQSTSTCSSKISLAYSGGRVGTISKQKSSWVNSMSYFKSSVRLKES